MPAFQPETLKVPVTLDVSALTDETLDALWDALRDRQAARIRAAQKALEDARHTADHAANLAKWDVHDAERAYVNELFRGRAFFKGPHDHNHEQDPPRADP